jgi:ParB family chromosome partitioning protein
MEVNEMSEAKSYQQIRVDALVPFKNHPFTQYEGARFDDMVKSVAVNGVLVPIIVRPVADGKYEILSGHNRVAAAKQVELETVPAVVSEGLTDDEAMFVVTETNLIQRSFADMKHSERAIVIANHYAVLKKKSGYRSDLLEEIEQLTSSPLARRTSMEKLGEQYGLSKDTIARYLRVNELIFALKARLDNGEIALRVAVTLSYLKKVDQEAVEKQLAKGMKLTIKIANLLRDEANKGELSKDFIKRVFEPTYFPTKIKPVKFSGQFLSEFFDEGKSSEEIEATVAEALRAYLSK